VFEAIESTLADLPTYLEAVLKFPP